MSAREDVLRRVRAALGGSGAGTTAAGKVGTAPAPVEVPRAYRATGVHEAGSAEVLEQLVDRLVDYRAHVQRVAADDLPAVVAETLAEAGSVVVPPGLDEAWLGDLPRDVVVHRDAPDAPLSALDLDATGAVLTAARVACSETGTIVLDGEPDQGRRAISLVPDVHVCVVRADQVVETIPEAVRILAPHAERPQTWISGPSATSDIELDRVEGVHGPRTLHVLLVA
ncbi:L-lactate dehydrogenase complex protein LldG [Isoptericola sp. CG 20/1183]|uniref:L-lactate dehydrogenase complex protein LldG n=1 Tax=Isoptericola halotolerans TaxID=300560 RepID=A0ABX5EL36_9MICO|nr:MULTISPECIES: lactate utilization protein C [Isoptericola]PRZ09582.1 L-lactate dehydrogenase complex protein LldG [Isoptericola sp. CG 20/1183]PRZ10383.1 L-lactate dehydrogenase complex protein LldG [Isoptericola halotolerans]